MYVGDLEGQVCVDRQDELVARLRSVRKGRYGAFILWHGETGRWHDDAGPALWVHINDDIAYLHFFADQHGRHAGFQPKGMLPANSREDVRFMLTDGREADGFTMPRNALVSVDAAYRAATEFFKVPVLPASICWSEL